MTREEKETKLISENIKLTDKLNKLENSLNKRLENATRNWEQAQIREDVFASLKLEIAMNLLGEILSEIKESDKKDELIEIQYSNYSRGNWITISSKTIAYVKGGIRQESIPIYLLQAINKQVEELGWVE